MKELLERWAELEPKRCDYGNDPFATDREYCQVIMDDKMGWIGPRSGDPRDGYYPQNIQYATQQAIEARGWMWDLKTDYFNSEGKPTYLANIFGDAKWVKSKNSPAEALLSAYLSALEAVKTQEVAG